MSDTLMLHALPVAQPAAPGFFRKLLASLVASQTRLIEARGYMMLHFPPL